MNDHLHGAPLLLGWLFIAAIVVGFWMLAGCVLRVLWKIGLGVVG